MPGPTVPALKGSVWGDSDVHCTPRKTSLAGRYTFVDFLYPESVSIHQCASFVVCDMPIKVNFIGMLQAMKVVC